MSSNYESVHGLGDASQWITSSERELVDMLLLEKQEHLFANWKEGADEDKKHQFFRQIEALNGGYPGGLKAYLKKARELLLASEEGKNPFEGYKPEVPHGEALEYGDDAFCEHETLGVEAFKDCAFVLVAGGLGERLGYQGIKVSLPVELTSGKSYLELYIKQILALQKQSNALNGTSETVPLAIMTSDDTHDRTVELLKQHNNFGAAADQIKFMKQEKVAALIDSDAHIAVDEHDPYSLVTKPHGHGDVHTLLHSTGIAHDWAAAGKKHVIFFQDTNALCFSVISAAIGVSVKSKFEVNSVTVPRRAKEAVGAIVRLKKEDGSSLTCNVEYNQLEPLLKASGYPEGDVNDESGYSPFPGNINQLIFALEPYVKVLERTKGLVPEFVNPKYADEAKTKFIKPTRLECMMQDHPQVMPAGSHVGFTQFPDWTYSVVKNGPDEAAKKAAAKVPLRNPAEGEMEYYGYGVRLLQSAGAQVESAKTDSLGGFPLPHPAHVVFEPNFATSYSTFTKKISSDNKIKLTQRSTLHIDGPDVILHELDLDGALIIRAVPGAKVQVKNLKVRNDGWELQPLSEGEQVPEYLQIRGYKLVKKSDKIVEYNEPGEYVLEGEF